MEMGVTKMVAFIYTLLISLVTISVALITEQPMPQLLCNCFNRELSASKDEPGAMIIYTCVNKYLAITWRDRYYQKMSNDPEVINWFKSLYRKNKSLEYHSRLKRQTGSLLHGTRQEIRTLSNAQRRRFITAVQRLKTTRVGSTNRYDAIAAAHDGPALENAHFGPNFLGWHREYLLLFETALRQIDSRVVLPYWDTRLEYNLRNELESNIWDLSFMGDSQGVVSYGPFARWRQPNGAFLERSAGADGSYIPPVGIQRVLSRQSNIQISEPWAADRFSLENYHNAVHMRVGGSMTGLNTAPADPIFFLHHAFIDCVWEDFRRQQTYPERDYPWNNQARRSQRPSERMINLESNKRNIEGYSNEYTQRYYRCARSPQTCRECRNRRNLRCGTWNPGLCAAGRQSRRTSARARNALQDEPKNKPLGISQSFRSTIIDKRKNNRGKRSIPAADFSMNFTKMFSHEDYPEKIPKTWRPSESELESPIQNSFVIDGVPDIKRWVFIPVIVKHKRPPGLYFNSKVIVHGDIQAGVDVYSYAMILNDTKTNRDQATFPNRNIPSKVGFDKVFVQVDGLSYSGKYKDYAVVDSRLPISESVTFVGVKSPKLNNSRSYVSAYDSHGRLCHAYCLVYGSNPPEYKKCSGVIDLTTTSPFMYGDSIGESNGLLYRKLKSVNHVRSYENVFLTFHCDYDDTPWSQCK